MKITVQSKRKKLSTLERDFPAAKIVDVTSKAALPILKFSPFYPIGNIPIPYSNGQTAASVEGIWQGLKVFESEGIDPKKFAVTNMKGLKRTVRKLGIPKGHQKGLEHTELLDYITARKLIYLPVYKWVLENALQEEIALLNTWATQQPLVLLDYETNGDVEDPSKPLSHAQLIRLYLEGAL